MIVQNNQVHEWWNQNYPAEPLLTIKKPLGGAMTQSFILNDNKILKVYFSKDGTESRKDFFFNAKKAIGLLDGFEDCIAKVVGIFENDKILGASAICTEYIESTDMSKILYKLDPQEIFAHGRKIGEIIRKMHEATTISNQEYDTQKLLDRARKALEFALENKLLKNEDYELINTFVNNYKSRIIKTDFVLVHQDLHPENYLIDKDKK